MPLKQIDYSSKETTSASILDRVQAAVERGGKEGFTLLELVSATELSDSIVSGALSKLKQDGYVFAMTSGFTPTRWVSRLVGRKPQPKPIPADLLEETIHLMIHAKNHLDLDLAQMTHFDSVISRLTAISPR